MAIDKDTLIEQFPGLSDSDAEEVLDDMVVAGVLEKYDADGKPQEVKRTKARVTKVRKQLEHASYPYDNGSDDEMDVR